MHNRARNTLGTLNPAVAAAKTGGRAPIQALRASTAAALVNSLLPSSASHLPLPYAPSPADGGWCRVETAPAPFKSPYHTQKVGQEGVHLPHSAQNLPLLCKALSKSQKEAVGLTCWEAFIGLGTNFPSVFWNRSLISLHVWECWCFLNWSLHVFVVVKALQSCANTAR